MLNQDLSAVVDAKSDASGSFRIATCDVADESSSIGSQNPADLDQKRRHMSERVFYPDTDNVSSTSKVVARSVAVFRFNA